MPLTEGRKTTRNGDGDTPLLDEVKDVFHILQNSGEPSYNSICLKDSHCCVVSEECANSR